MNMMSGSPPWKGRMTARERFNRQMNFQEVERCVNYEFGYWLSEPSST